MSSYMKPLLVIAAWYASNIGVLLLNKYLLTNTQFRQPVFLTLCHMVACAFMSYGISAAGFTPIKPLKSRRQLWKVTVLSVIFCFTIVLGNLSLKYIPVSFNQAVGATTPFFTAIFAVMLQGMWETRATYATLVPIAVGVVIASGGEPSFHMIGFTACILSAALRALKSVMQAMMLTDPNEKLDAMSLLFYMSSVSIMLLLPASALLEPSAFNKVRLMITADPHFFWWLLTNSCLAYAVNLTNFLVTKFTSALTLQVLGNCKGVIATFVSVLMFRNPVTLKGIFGYAVTLSGVFMYSEAKRRLKLRRQETESQKSHLQLTDLDTEMGEPPLLKVGHHNGLGSPNGMNGLNGLNGDIMKIVMTHDEPTVEAGGARLYLTGQTTSGGVAGGYQQRVPLSTRTASPQV